MKFSLVVTEITHDELVNIFSILPAEHDFEVNIKREDWKKIEKKALAEWAKTHPNDEYCFEDKCADILLNGGKIYVTDIYAEGVVYGTLKHSVDEEDESVTYEVKLNDFFRGFCNPDAMEHVKDLADGNDDYETAFCLIQYATFGEEIYG